MGRTANGAQEREPHRSDAKSRRGAVVALPQPSEPSSTADFAYRRGKGRVLTALSVSLRASAGLLIDALVKFVDGCVRSARTVPNSNSEISCLSSSCRLAISRQSSQMGSDGKPGCELSPQGRAINGSPFASGMTSGDVWPTTFCGASELAVYCSLFLPSHFVASRL